MGVREQKQIAARSDYESAAVFEFVKFVLTPGSGTINVAMQLQNANGVNLVPPAAPAAFRAYLSDSPLGAGLTGTTPSGGVVIGTNGAVLVAPVASKIFDCLSKSDGTIDLTITQATTHTFYLVVINPLGFLIVSPAIVF